MVKDVGKYFREKETYTRGELLRNPDMSEEEKVENERTLDKYDNWSRDLRGLFRAKPGKLEKFQQKPDMFAEALSVVAGRMGSSNPEDPRTSYEDLDEDSKREQKETHETSKKMFMEGCKRLYPDVKVPPVHRWESVLKRMNEDVDKLEMPMGATDADFDLIAENLHNFRGNPKELMRMIDGAISSAGGSAELKAWKGVEPEFAEQEQELLSDEEEKELAKVNKMIYKLQLMRDGVAEQVGKGKKGTYSREELEKRKEELAKVRIKPEGKRKQREQKKEQAEEEKLSLLEVKKDFGDKSIKTIDDIKKLVTPEVKAAILESILEDVDRRIESGKILDDRESTPQAVEARNMVSVVGNSSATNLYQFPASVVEGRIVDAITLPRMKIYEYLKKYLDYDLKNDEKRRKDLERYTNMLV